MNEKENLVEYVEKLYQAALAKTGDSHVAEDMVQETFLVAVQNLQKGKIPENLWSWLLAVLSNKYCDWLREKYNRPQVSFEDYPFEIPAEELDDDSEEKLEAVRRELGYLARIHREVMVRFYLRGDTIETIAGELGIPAGTVKSRLNTGRRHIRERVNNMENYTKQSYQPDILHIACSGAVGFNDEPFSLVGETDRLTQNVLILAYEKPVSESELAMALGVPAAFVEPVVEKMVAGELMKRTESGKVYTDFIIYTEKDMKATLQKQLAVVDEHFDVFWNGTEEALAELRGREWYRRQPEGVREKLEFHFLVKLLLNAHIKVREEVTGPMPYSEYPYRKDGGRWIAMGNRYPADGALLKDKEFWKYGIDGEFGCSFKNFRDAKSVELRGYGTSLGTYPVRYLKKDYVTWLYELYLGIPQEDSAVDGHILEAAGELLKENILKREDRLVLNIPVLTMAESTEEHKLTQAFEERLSRDIREVLLPVFDSGYVRLPAHLKSVPKWQQYMFCGDSVPMAVIFKAMEKKLLFPGVKDKLPGVILIEDT